MELGGKFTLVQEIVEIHAYCFHCTHFPCTFEDPSILLPSVNVLEVLFFLSVFLYVQIGKHK